MSDKPVGVRAMIDVFALQGLPLRRGRPRGRWLCRHPTSVVVPPPDRVTGATREPYSDQCLFVRIDQENVPTETMRVSGPGPGGA